MIERRLILELVGNICHISEDMLSMASSKADLGLDSLRLVQLVLDLDRRSNGRLTELQVESLYAARTLGDLCAVLEEGAHPPSELS